jgi:hypothetical protein
MTPEPDTTTVNRRDHRWRFFRAGGFDQVRLDTGADLLNLEKLDQKLWVALSCPARGLEFDSKTLELIDRDKDGRIRVPELLAAVKWACAMLNDTDLLVQGASSLPLSAINDRTPEGQQLLASARQILVNLGKADATTISLEDTSDTTRIFAQTLFNGDGIVPAESADDDATRALIADVVTCFGAEVDRSGKPGVGQAKVDQFFAEAQAYSDWWKQAETEPGKFLPFGEQTTKAVAAFKAVRAKVDDYFARCRVAAFDSRALTAVNSQESEYLAVAAKDMSITVAELAGFPLAHVEVGRPLPLQAGLNPAWADAVRALHETVVRPLLGDKASLTVDDWSMICSKLSANEAWTSAKAGASVEKLGLERVRQLLKGPGKDAVTTLIARDKALEPQANAIASVHRLARYCRDLGTLLNNFVSFRDFYTRKAKGIFQAGTLYLDGRSCELCVRVEDTGKHAALAGLAKTYLAYCDCSRPATGEKLTIAAAFTGGDSDNLMIGRNGLFYDRQGRDWEATITKIIDNPISIRQAFWAPYKKFVRIIEEQIAKRAATADGASTAKLETTATSVITADKGKPGEPKKIDVGTVAALGVALGAIGTLLGGFIAGFLKLTVWQMPLAIIGILLVISAPSVLIAWLKLRQRNLGPILDANGWAVNARARINVPFGAALTGVAKLPSGAESSLTDPYAEKRHPWGLYAALLIALVLGLLWYIGRLDRLLPGNWKSTHVLGTNAPAWKPGPVEVPPK